MDFITSAEAMVYAIALLIAAVAWGLIRVERRRESERQADRAQWSLAYVDTHLNGVPTRLYRSNGADARYYDIHGARYVYVGSGRFLPVVAAQALQEARARRAREEAVKEDSSGSPDTVTVIPADRFWPGGTHFADTQVQRRPYHGEDRRGWHDTIQTKEEEGGERGSPE